MANTAAQNTFFALDNHYYQAGLDDPTVVPTDGTRGSFYLRVSVDGVSPIAAYTKNDDGVSTNWTLFSGGGGSVNPAREDFTLTNPIIALGYVDLGTIALQPTVIVNLQGAGLLSLGAGQDYTLSVVGLATRVTFDATLIPLLLAGQKIQIQYLY